MPNPPVPNVALGKYALSRLFFHVARKSWYTEIKNLRTKVVEAYSERSEIVSGGIVTDGTATATEMMCSVTAVSSVLKGRVMAAIPAISDDDLLDAATAGVQQPIYADGSDASGLSLGADETAYVTLIVCNSDGSGDAVENDDGAAQIVAIVAGTAATYASASAHLSSSEIQAALDASTGVHDGVTAWAHLSQCLYADTSGSSWLVTPTMNRNNVVSEA